VTKDEQDLIVSTLQFVGPSTPERLAARLGWPVHLTYRRLVRLSLEGAIKRRDIYSVEGA